MTVRYISGAHHDNTAAVAHQAGIGLLTTPATNYRATKRNGDPVLAAYPFWAADNGAYKRGADHRDFDFAAWSGWVQSIVDTTPADVMSRHLFFTAPDAIDVDPTGREVTSHPAETLARAARWLPWMRSLGLRTALVVQPGMKPSEIPWDQVDAVFIGGDTAWKEDPQGGGRVAAVARQLGKHVHMGRVNTRRRLQLADDFGCDTADGTKLAFGNDANLPELLRWLDELAAQG